MKDVNTHTRVMKLKQQALADRLKMCLLELKKLCIREAVSYCSHSLLIQNTPEERQDSFHTGIRGDFYCMLRPSCFWSLIFIFKNNFFRRHVKCCRMLNGYVIKNKKHNSHLCQANDWVSKLPKVWSSSDPEALWCISPPKMLSHRNASLLPVGVTCCGLSRCSSVFHDTFMPQ